jgi:hypothetical protein
MTREDKIRALLLICESSCPGYHESDKVCVLGILANLNPSINIKTFLNSLPDKIVDELWEYHNCCSKKFKKKS